MAAFAQNSTRLSSFFPASSPEEVECEGDGQVDARVDGKGTAAFGNRAAGGSQNGHEDHAISEREMPLDPQIVDRGENFSSCQSTTMDGILNITIHHARDIQNICIYGNQDVYAKFSLTSRQDEIFCTHPVKSGGRNPVFNQSLQIPVAHRDAILKCEIWMLSCTRSYLEDQLLGFVLVPLPWLVGKGNVTQDYMLSSTELFHTPVGRVCLSLALVSTGNLPEASYNDTRGNVCTDGSVPACSLPSSSEVMLMDGGNHCLSIQDYNKIEFPDLEAVSQNHHMISLYFNVTSGDLKLESGTNGEVFEGNKVGDYGGTSAEHQKLPGASFLQLSSSPMEDGDSEMTLNMGEEKCVDNGQRDSELFKGSCASSLGSLSCVDSLVRCIAVNATPCSTEDQKVTASQEHNGSCLPNVSSSSYGTPLQSSGSMSSNVESLSCSSSMMKENNNDNDKVTAISNDDESVTFTTPLVNIKLEPEEPVVQQQIIDMYMKSMQQFTESLAKMKLPLDLDTQGQTDCTNSKVKSKGTKAEQNEGHKVFYGSRAFF